MVLATYDVAGGIANCRSATGKPAFDVDAVMSFAWL
jgi:hypothetical protein